MRGRDPGASRSPRACTGSSARCRIDGLRAVNVYAIDDGDGVALVDTGWNHPDIVAALDRRARSSLERITAIICTHSHYDHYGLAGQLREWSGAPVLLGREELPNLAGVLDRDGYERASAMARERMVLHGAEAPLERRDGSYERGRGARPVGRARPAARRRRADRARTRACSRPS